MSELPVVVIGAGPQGLAAAAHLLERGIEPLVIEAGDGPASAVAEWGHVRLFSPWPELVDQAAERLLAPGGWAAPGQGYPTGAEWVAGYLRPLAEALGGRVRYGTRVTGVSRKGRDRLVDAGRGDQPFTVHVTGQGGDEGKLYARAVIDASGTWRQPNPAGADGLPALGERAAAGEGLVRYQIPDFAAPEPFAGRHTVVLGAGHSAATAVIELARIARANPGTRVTWALRRATAERRDRRQRRRRAARARRPRDPRGQGGGRGHRHPGDRVPHRADPPGRRGKGGAGGGGRAGAAPGGHGGGPDRLPAGPGVPLGTAARPGPGAPGAPEDRAGASTRTSTPAAPRPPPWRRTWRSPSRACTWWG